MCDVRYIVDCNIQLGWDVCNGTIGIQANEINSVFREGFRDFFRPTSFVVTTLFERIDRFEWHECWSD